MRLTEQGLVGRCWSGCLAAFRASIVNQTFETRQALVSQLTKKLSKRTAGANMKFARVNCHWTGRLGSPRCAVTRPLLTGSTFNWARSQLGCTVDRGPLATLRRTCPL